MHCYVDFVPEQRLLQFLDKDPAPADLVQRLGAVPVALGLYLDQADLDVGRGLPQLPHDLLRLGQRQSAAPGADDQPPSPCQVL